MDATDTTLTEQLRLVNHDLASVPFYIGTTRRRIAGLGLAVRLHRDRGAIVGSIAADLVEQPHQPGRPHPLAATAVTIRGDDRRSVVGAGNLDDTGCYPIAELQLQLCYYLHFGEE